MCGCRVLLGHRRLAIVGTQELGAQPMSEKGVALVCNGELYGSSPLADPPPPLPSGQGESDCKVRVRGRMSTRDVVLPDDPIKSDLRDSATTSNRINSDYIAADDDAGAVVTDNSAALACFSRSLLRGARSSPARP